MGEKRRAALLLLFISATALFNWPLAGLFLEAKLSRAMAGLFIAMALFTAALFRLARHDRSDDGGDADDRNGGARGGPSGLGG